MPSYTCVNKDFNALLNAAKIKQIVLIEILKKKYDARDRSLSLDPATFSRWKKGREKLDFDYVKAISEILAENINLYDEDKTWAWKEIFEIITGKFIEKEINNLERDLSEHIKQRAVNEKDIDSIDGQDGNYDSIDKEILMIENRIEVLKNKLKGQSEENDEDDDAISYRKSYEEGLKEGFADFGSELKGIYNIFSAFFEFASDNMLYASRNIVPICKDIIIGIKSIFIEKNRLSSVKNIFFYSFEIISLFALILISLIIFLIPITIVIIILFLIAFLIMNRILY